MIKKAMLLVKLSFLTECRFSLTVTLTREPVMGFRRFFIQARRLGTGIPTTGDAVGTFSNFDEKQTAQFFCPGTNEAVLTARDATSIVNDFVSFTWTPPGRNSGAVEFM